MALNNDLAPTFASWAGARLPRFVDGCSLAPLLRSSLSASWRTALLVEDRHTPEEFGYVRAIPDYSTLRTARYNYVEYGTGEREPYDLDADPTELTNIHASASPTLLSDLRSRLVRLRGCRGADRSTAENEG
jgi:N-acetylglucosamine-6-sulfatase